MNTRLLPVSLTLLLVAMATGRPAGADVFPLPPSDVDLVGAVQITRASAEDTLLDIAARFNLGQQEILLANPGVDRWLPGDGKQVILPTRFILPDAPRQGIVLNVAEMRLYYYPRPAGGQPAQVVTHPVSIGRMDWTTPLGLTKVVTKQRDPPWIPPQSVKDEAAAEGKEIPDIVPPGPSNPLGAYALRLALPGYLIHGTNRPFGIGMRVTHGCVRMYPQDIEQLFEEVSVGTPVRIVNQPVKVGWLADTLYLELHPFLEKHSDSAAKELRGTALELIYEAIERRPAILDGGAIRRSLEAVDGIPSAISKTIGR